MRKFLTMLSLIFFTKGLIAQCISGNCENGTGYFKYENGNTYEGYFKNGIKEPFSHVTNPNIKNIIPIIIILSILVNILPRRLRR